MADPIGLVVLRVLHALNTDGRPATLSAIVRAVQLSAVPSVDEIRTVRDVLAEAKERGLVRAVSHFAGIHDSDVRMLTHYKITPAGSETINSFTEIQERSNTAVT